jgi:hypothetical protein
MGHIIGLFDGTAIFGFRCLNPDFPIDIKLSFGNPIERAI